MGANIFNWRIAILTWLFVLCFDAGIVGIDKLDTAFLHKAFPVFFLWTLINAPGVHSLAFAAALFWGHHVATVNFGTTYWIVGISLVSATFWSAIFGFVSARLTKRGAGNGGTALVGHVGRPRPAVPEPGRWTV